MVEKKINVHRVKNGDKKEICETINTVYGESDNVLMADSKSPFWGNVFDEVIKSEEKSGEHSKENIEETEDKKNKLNQMNKNVHQKKINKMHNCKTDDYDKFDKILLTMIIMILVLLMIRLHYSKR